jgi:hypothetical protein
VQNLIAVFQLNFSNKTSIFASFSRPKAKTPTFSGYITAEPKNRQKNEIYNPDFFTTNDNVTICIRTRKITYS